MNAAISWTSKDGERWMMMVRRWRTTTTS